MSKPKSASHLIQFNRDNRQYHSALPVRPVYFPNRREEFQNVDWDSLKKTQSQRGNLQYRRSDGHLYADASYRREGGGERLRYQRPTVKQQTINGQPKQPQLQMYNVNQTQTIASVPHPGFFTTEARCAHHNTIRDGIKHTVSVWKTVIKDVPRLKLKTKPDIPVTMLINIVDSMGKQVATWKKEIANVWSLKSEFKGAESVNSSNELREVVQRQTSINEIRNKEIRELKQRVEDLKQDVIQLTQSRKKIATEKEEALMRLSEMAATNLLDNNVAIADLSTEIRPTRIAEDFRELYDNEWTNAFETFSQNDAQTERRIIALLLHIVTDSFEFTREEADRTLNRLMSALDENDDEVESTNLTRESNDLIRRLRKSESENMAANIIRKYLNRLDTDENFEHPLNQKVRAYASKCARITWYMNVQVPPMAISYQSKHGDTFDSRIYSEYTQLGKVIDFVVWPAAFIERDGDLVCKGIAQPIKESWAL